MFENVAEKLKTLAWVTLVLGMLITVVTGIFLLTIGGQFIIGIIILVSGSLGTWTISCVLYALGELLESNCEIQKKICGYNNGNSKFKSTGKCEICNKDGVELHRCKINDTVGWADMCEKCMKKQNK